MDPLHKLIQPKNDPPKLGDITGGGPKEAIAAMHGEKRQTFSVPQNTTQTTEELERRYTYHAPTQEQVLIYQSLRDHAKSFAAHIESVCPSSREKAIAHTLLQQCVQMANAAIAIHSEPVAK